MTAEFRVQFHTENAAFEDDKHSETARILKEIAKKVDEGENDGNIFDINGNKIGSWFFNE